MMYRHHPAVRPTFLQARNRSAPLLHNGHNSPSIQLGMRCGQAITELLLIVLVPCLCLFVWSLFDPEIKQSLLAGADTESFGPRNPVYDMVKGDGDIVITVRSQGQLGFWDLSKSEFQGEIQSDLVEVRCGAYSTKQRLLVVGSAMGQLEMWDLDQPDQSATSTARQLNEITNCQFTPDGTLLITADAQGGLSFWEPRTLRRLQVAPGPNPGESMRSMQISGDGKCLLAGLVTGKVQVWDLESRSVTRVISVARTERRPASCVEGVAFLPDSREFVAATNSEGISVWNVETGELVRSCTEPLVGIRSGALSPDGKRFVSGADHGRLRIWDIATGLPIQSVAQTSPSIIRSVAFDNRGKMLLTGDCSGDVNLRSL